ncbi:MAG TPA: LytR C-terminal domain-containing protein [Solirubrobacteraceae bacterium]|nr:LytR C-terminal domain-containing protein [Solirubrobacteraceae bacterium]
MVLALSLSSDVKSIGAYAGFAAIIGLALLVILYFAQARETRRLTDALEELEARLRRIPPPTVATMPRPVAAVGAATPVAQSRPVAVPAAAVPATPQTAVPAAPPTATVAVPGARRVAVTPAATVVAVPDPTEAEAGDAVTDVRPAQTEAATPPPSAPVESAEDDATPADPPPTPEPSSEPAAPAPPPSILPAATAAGAAAAAAKPDTPDDDEPEATTTVRPAAMPLVARPAATAEAPSEAPATQGNAAPTAALADPPPPRYPPAPGERAAPVGATARISGRGEGATATLRRERRADAEQAEDGEGHHHLGSRGTLRLLAVAIVLVGVLIFVANELLSGGSPSHSPPNAPQTSTGPAPATITVAVLNGTSSSGLASRVSTTLVNDGFKPGAINNAPSHNLASTTVQYIHSSDIAAANEVAHDLQLTTTQVIRADAATIAAATIAGRVPQVIAVIGTNYAQ